ncbi:uncharacterized protein LOC117079342 [Trachypithecus francoisi]|uniref:uncharacterized protein LOC117079342 n=1 Tax=Trachypithecus francoisi TaxID=54180 RepID=UPI00141B29D0|nr:uncharacterized protein LOC117079342 [Trachypithecus francoisi]
MASPSESCRRAAGRAARQSPVAPALLSPWAVDGTRRHEAGGGALWGGLGPAGAHSGPEPCPVGRQLRPQEISSTAPTGQYCRGTGAPSAAAGWSAKPLTAQGQQCRPAAPSAGPLSRRLPHGPVSATGSPASHWCLSLHTSPQAEGASSSLGQPRVGLPQCSGRLKGSSSATRVDAKAEEAPRVRAASMLSLLTSTYCSSPG